MKSKSIELKNLMDIYSALENDLITPIQAVNLTCKALKMFHIETDSLPSKKEVLHQILYIDEVIKKGWEIPIFFCLDTDSFLKPESNF
jgi:hypothetical protein